jgi:hypothetical protein
VVAEGDRRAELDAVRKRTSDATRLMLGAAAVAIAGLAALDARLVLLPVAFVLGWLNLAGL